MDDQDEQFYGYEDEELYGSESTAGFETASSNQQSRSESDSGRDDEIHVHGVHPCPKCEPTEKQVRRREILAVALGILFLILLIVDITLLALILGCGGNGLDDCDPELTDNVTLVRTESGRGRVKVGDELAYKCAPAFKMVEGNTSRTCTRRRTLTGSPLVCTPAGCPIGPRWNYLESTKLCYKVFNETLMDVRGASLKCREMSCQLATPKTLEENIHVAGAMADVSSEKIYWIGLGDQQTEGKYMWLNDQRLGGAWSNWDQGQPTTDGDCVIGGQGDNGTWRVDDCSHRKPFLCQCHPLDLDESTEGDTSCDVEPPTTNVTLMTNDRKLQLGQVAKYRCKDGFMVISGDAVRICAEGNLLNGTTLECVIEQLRIPTKVNEYTTYVKTGTSPTPDENWGMNCRVDIRLYGPGTISEWYRNLDGEGNDFEEGQTDTITMRSQDVGLIQKMDFHFRPRWGYYCDWYPEWISVYDGERDMTYTFLINQLLKGETMLTLTSPIIRSGNHKSGP